MKTITIIMVLFILLFLIYRCQPKSRKMFILNLLTQVSSVRLGFCLCHYFLIFDNIVSV